MASCFTLPVQAALSWNIQTVDEYAVAIGSSHIALDCKDFPHIAYNAACYPTWQVAYTSWNGSNWEKQMVADHSLIECFVLDSNDNPHILFYSYASSQMEHAVNSGDGWATQKTGLHGSTFSMALDSSGYPHVAYTEGGKIKYANYLGKTWSSQTIDNGTDVKGVFIALDSKNNPYILYNPSTTDASNTMAVLRSVTTKLATINNGAWNTQTLSLPAPTGQIGNLVVDSKGSLHFIFTEHHFVSHNSSKILTTIMYASKDSAGWRTQTVASNIEEWDLLLIGQLVLDAADNPHFTYLTSAPEGQTQSVYVTWAGKSWSTHVIPTSNGKTATGSLALDDEGIPHISNRQQSGARYMGPLLYVTETETTETPSPSSTDAATYADVQSIPYDIITVVLLVMAMSAVVVILWKRKTPKKALSTQIFPNYLTME